MKAIERDTHTQTETETGTERQRERGEREKVKARERKRGGGVREITIWQQVSQLVYDVDTMLYNPSNSLALPSDTMAPIQIIKSNWLFLNR